MTNDLQISEASERRPIPALEELAQYAGKIVRYSFNAGKSWTYTRISDPVDFGYFSSYKYQAAPLGIRTYEQVDPNGVGILGSILEPDFDDPNFRVVPASSDEVAGIEFTRSV